MGKCPFCESELIWLNAYTYYEEGSPVDVYITEFKCEYCGAMAEFYQEEEAEDWEEEDWEEEDFEEEGDC